MQLSRNHFDFQRFSFCFSLQSEGAQIMWLSEKSHKMLTEKSHLKDNYGQNIVKCFPVHGWMTDVEVSIAG